MKILVFFKTVPIWERVLERDWEAFCLHSDLSYAGKEINCFDEAALELGLRLRDEYIKQGREAHCFAATAKTLHPSFAHTLFAAGYEDVAILGSGHAEFASEEVARLLADYARASECDLILTGAAAGMADTGTVPLRIAHLLDYPFIANALELHAREDALEVLSQEPDYVCRRVVRTPLLVCVGNSPAALRAATLRARLAVRDREARTLRSEIRIASDAQGITFSRSAERRACEFLNFALLPGLVGALLETELSVETNAHSVQRRSFCPPNAVVYDAQTVPWHGAEYAFGSLLANWRSRKPDYAIFDDTSVGRALAYRLARETNAFFLTGASFSEDGESLIRRACASNVFALHKPRIPAILTMERPPAEAQRVLLEAEDGKAPSWLLDEEKLPCAGGSLQNRKIILICGAGMGNRVNCELARTLAQRLGGGFGLTRAAALSGWGEPAEIVGQSGAAIAPKVCLVLGASGAGAFAAGIEKAACVVAVNTDEKALIFRHADVGVIADAPLAIRALLDALPNAPKP